MPPTTIKRYRNENCRKVSFEEIDVLQSEHGQCHPKVQLWPGKCIKSPLDVYTLVGWAGDLTCGGLNPGGGALNGSGDASSSSTYNTKCDSMVTAALSGTGHERNLNNNQHFSFSCQ